METTTNTPTAEDLVAIAPEIALAKSVVKTAYKKKYAERALLAKGTKGVSKKARARSCGDWLSLTLQKLTLGEKDAIDLDAFRSILDANGVDHARWTNRSKGWEGRFRMTGRLALQRVVAEGGELEIPVELATAKGVDTTIVAPASWVKAHTH